MRLEQLKTVVTVWRLRSVSKAAQELSLTQPAVSGHVKAMETMIGKPLFHRHARGVDPTKTADELVRSIGTAIEQAEAAVERVRDRSEDRTGVVHLGAPTEFSNARLAPVLAALTRQGIEPRLRQGGRDQLYAWFRDGDIDIGITASEPALPQLDYEPVFQERLLLVGQSRFKREIETSGLEQWVHTARWLAYDESLPLIRSWFAKVLGHATTARALAICPSLTLLRDMAIEGAGVTVLPHYLCAEELENGRFEQLHYPPTDPTNVIYLCWRRTAMRNPRISACRPLIHSMLVSPRS